MGVFIMAQVLKTRLTDEQRNGLSAAQRADYDFLLAADNANWNFDATIKAMGKDPADKEARQEISSKAAQLRNAAAQKGKVIPKFEGTKRGRQAVDRSPVFELI